jgi:hypothetical protein
MSRPRLYPERPLTQAEKSRRRRLRQKGLLPPAPRRPKPPDLGLLGAEELGLRTLEELLGAPILTFDEMFGAPLLTLEEAFALSGQEKKTAPADGSGAA